MDRDFEIINSQVVFAYNRNLQVRKRQFEYEDALKDLFTIPFQNIAVADNQDGNIPRFEGVSKNQNSRLQVNQFSCNFITAYKGEYRNNLDLIKSYLQERIPLLKKVVSEESNQFIAYIIELGYRFESEAEINDLLKRSCGVNALKTTTKTFSLQYSEEFKNDYYLNIKASKYTEGQYNLVDGNLIPKGPETRGISVILDLNSKLRFINKKDFNIDILEALEAETFSILNKNNLENYLNGQIL